MPHFLIKDQSTEAFTPGWIVHKGAMGGWLVPNEESKETLRLMPLVAVIMFVLVAGMTYAFDTDDSGAGFSTTKVAILGVVALILAMGAFASWTKSARRRRLGDTRIEIDDALLAPGVRTRLRVYQTQTLPIRSLVVDVVCRHRGLGTSSDVWSQVLCKHESGAMPAGEAFWEGPIEIPADANVPRPKEAKLKNGTWDPAINVLGPSLEITGRTAGRSAQSRYWQIRLSIWPTEGRVIRERFDLRVFSPSDRQSLVVSHDAA